MPFPVTFTGRLQGQTAAGVAIAALDINFTGDGYLSFTDPATGRRWHAGVSGEIGNALRLLFTGPGGHGPAGRWRG